MPLQFSEPVDGKYHGEAVVLSGQTLHHHKLGTFSIDLPTLEYHKERLPVDYNHDANQILGFAENFRVTDDKLVADVYLTESNKKVQEIIAHIQTGTPFEISPSIREEEGILENVAGIKRYKHVPMRGVAVCPFGTDRFTSLTLLHEETMTKNQTTTTNLSDDSASGEPQETKVKDPNLAEFISVYGKDKGIDLYQSGADINDVRMLKEIIEKYGVPEPPGTEPTTELNEEEPPADPKEDDDAKKETTELKSLVTKLAAEVTKLSAAVPRGEAAPVKHGFQQEPEKKELTEKEKYLASVQKCMKK